MLSSGIGEWTVLELSMTHFKPTYKFSSWWQNLKKSPSNDFSFSLDVELGAMHPLACRSK